jgi:hypothetical protein
MPYYLDYICINGTVEDDAQPLPTFSTTPQQQKSPPITALVGGITGGLVFNYRHNVVPLTTTEIAETGFLKSCYRIR